jgi:hypothetical protein
MLPEMDGRIQAAAETFEQAVLDIHRDERGVHVNTLLSTTAAIVAEAVLRATVPDEQLYGDRGIMYSEAADSLLLTEEHGNVMDYIGFTANEAELTPIQMPDIDDIYRRTGAALGKSEIPVLTVPESQRPQFWSIAGAAFARPQVLEIYQRFDLKPREAVLMTTLVLCRFLNATQGVLDPGLAFRIVLETLVGAVRIHPVSMKDVEQMTKQ